MDNNTHSKYRLLINEFEYLTKQLTQVKEICSIASPQFQEDLMNYMNEDIGYKKYSPALSSSGSTEYNHTEYEKNIIEEIDKDNNVPSLYKKLFRKIVIKCHPDKIKENEHSDQFNEFLHLYRMTIDAYEEKKFHLLLIVALKLNIELDELKSDIKLVVKECKEMTNTINSLQNTPAFIYYMEDGEKKKEILQSYYHQFFKK